MIDLQICKITKYSRRNFYLDAVCIFLRINNRITKFSKELILLIDQVTCQLILTMINFGY